ncbi:MAG: hypothetical protein ABSF52_10670 [Syntrophobacteraceae bacterium]
MDCERLENIKAAIQRLPLKNSGPWRRGLHIVSRKSAKHWPAAAP